LIFLAVAMVVARHGIYVMDLGWKPDLRGEKVYVTEIEQGGKLEEGDQIVAINGKTPLLGTGIRGTPKLILPDSDSYLLRISRNGKEKEFSLERKVSQSPHHLMSVIVLLVASGISFFVAMLVGLSKPEERMPQLATLMGLSVAFLQLVSTLSPMESFLGTRDFQLAYLIGLISASPLSVAFGFDFFYRFPLDSKEKSRWLSMKYLLYIWSGTLAGYFTFIRGLMLYSLPKGFEFAMSRTYRFTINVDLLLNPLMLVSLPAICAVILWNFRKMKDPQSCNRIRWIAGGSILGVAPMIVYFLFESFRHSFSIFAITNQQLNSFFIAANLSLTLIPLAIGYGVVKHRVFGIEVVVRLGFRYLLAKHVLQLLIGCLHLF